MMPDRSCATCGYRVPVILWRGDDDGDHLIIVTDANGIAFSSVLAEGDGTIRFTATETVRIMLCRDLATDRAMVYGERNGADVRGIPVTVSGELPQGGHAAVPFDAPTRTFRHEWADVRDPDLIEPGDFAMLLDRPQYDVPPEPPRWRRALRRLIG